MNRALAVLCLILLGVALDTPNVLGEAVATNSLAARFGRGPLRVHDPSTIIRCKDEYWFFCTGVGILSRHSKDLVHWSSGPTAFSHPPAWATNAVPGNRGHFWAPDVIRLNQRYYLYYSVSTFGKNRSAIGLATNRTLDPADPAYAWEDAGLVIRSSPEDAFNTIDPGATMDLEGNLWLVFGSFWSGIKLVQLNPETGKRLLPDSPIYPLAHSNAIEAACIYPHNGHYYLFVNWGLCCRGVHSTYNIRIGRSDRITGPYLDKEGKDLLNGGGTLLLQTTDDFIGPGHAGILADNGKEWFSCHFYDGTRNGAPTLAVLPLNWTADDWPRLTQ